MEDEELVLAAEFESNPRALAACGLLRAAGIPAALKRAMPGILEPNWAHPDNDGLLLMVPASALLQARALLDSRVPDQDVIAAAEGAGRSGSNAGDIRKEAKEAHNVESNLFVPRSGHTGQGHPRRLKVLALIILLMVLAAFGQLVLTFVRYVIHGVWNI